MRGRVASGVACLLLFSLIFAFGEGSSARLPSAACVLGIRRARIAGMLEGDAARIEALAGLTDVCKGGQVQLLEEQERFYRGKPEYEAQYAEAYEKLIRYASDHLPSTPVRILDRLISDPEIGDADLARLKAAASAWVERNPEDPAALETLLRIQLRDEEFGRARETLGRLMAVDPKPYYLSSAYLLDVQLERWEPALSYVEKRLAEDPEDLYWRIQRIRVLAAVGKQDELMEAATPLLIDESGSRVDEVVSLLAPVAWELYDSGQMEQAEKLFRLLLAARPESAELQAAVTHLFSGEKERQARKALLERRWRQERSPLVLLKEGSARLGSGDAESAYPLLERATRIAPEWEVGWFNLGLAAIKLERWQEADDALTHLLKLKPEMAEGYYNRGLARTYLERYDEALSDLSNYTRSKPGDKNAWYYIYLCHKALGHADQAARALEKYR